MPLFGTSGGRNPQQGQQCLKNHREQGFSFKEISGSPGLHRRAGGNGQPGGSRLPGASLPVTSVGTNPSGCLESFWQSVIRSGSPPAGPVTPDPAWDCPRSWSPKKCLGQFACGFSPHYKASGAQGPLYDSPLKRQER